MTPEERAERVLGHAVAADTDGMISAALRMLADQTVHEVLSEDHIGMERMVTDRLRAALKVSIADAVTYLWEHRSFGTQPGQADPGGVAS